MSKIEVYSLTGLFKGRTLDIAYADVVLEHFSTITRAAAKVGKKSVFSDITEEMQLLVEYPHGLIRGSDRRRVSYWNLIFEGCRFTVYSSPKKGSYFEIWGTDKENFTPEKQQTCVRFLTALQYELSPLGL
jgi:hypothetical protein